MIPWTRCSKTTALDQIRLKDSVLPMKVLTMESQNLAKISTDIKWEQLKATMTLTVVWKVCSTLTQTSSNTFINSTFGGGGLKLGGG
jgi:hypothetical protein